MSRQEVEHPFKIYNQFILIVNWYTWLLSQSDILAFF